MWWHESLMWWRALVQMEEKLFMADINFKAPSPAAAAAYRLLQL